MNLSREQAEAWLIRLTQNFVQGVAKLEPFLLAAPEPIVPPPPTTASVSMTFPEPVTAVRCRVTGGGTMTCHTATGLALVANELAHATEVGWLELSVRKFDADGVDVSVPRLIDAVFTTETGGTFDQLTTT